MIDFKIRDLPRKNEHLGGGKNYCLRALEDEKNKIFLFIDGTNLYAGQLELFGPSQCLDFSKFIKEVEKNLKISFSQIFFYASYSPKSKKPTKKEKKYLKNEALFYRSVKKTKKVKFFKGYRSKTSGKEKEVDVKLTADIICYGFLNKYDWVYLLTGDADFLQALLTVKKFCPQKKIYLVCLENKLMYQGLFCFKTYVVVIKSMPKIKRRLRNLEVVKINKIKVVKTT